MAPGLSVTTRGTPGAVLPGQRSTFEFEYKMQYVNINCKSSPESCLIFLSPYHQDSDLETMESFNREYWKITIGPFLSIHHSNSLVNFDHPEFDYDRKSEFCASIESFENSPYTKYLRPQ